MQVFVTGICGRLGRALVAASAEHGIELVGVDVVPWPSAKMALPDHVQVHHGSYEDLHLVRGLLPGCDGLIHAGGPHGGDVGKIDLGRFIEAHTTSVARLLDEAVQAGVRSAVLSSTMEVQIGREWSANGAAWLDEHTPARTDSDYSLCRRLLEVLGEEYARQHPISMCSMRYMAFGYGDDRKAGLSLLARSVPALDVARAALLGVARRDLRGEIFNIGPETPLTPPDIGAAIHDPLSVLEKYFPGAGAVCEAAGVRLRSSHFWPVTSIQKAKAILGWRPRYTFRHWLVDHGWQPPLEQPAPEVPAATQV